MGHDKLMAVLFAMSGRNDGTFLEYIDGTELLMSTQGVMSLGQYLSLVEQRRVTDRVAAVVR